MLSSEFCFIIYFTSFSYKGKHFIGVAYFSEAQSTIILVGHTGMQADNGAEVAESSTSWR